MPFGTSPIAPNGALWVAGNKNGLISGVFSGGQNLVVMESFPRIALIRPGNGDIIYTNNDGGPSANIGTAGPVAGGRDQAGAFPNNSLLHGYFISNGVVLNAIVSLNPPFLLPSGLNPFNRNIGTLLQGPTLPAGYTHWAYCGSVPMNAAALYYGFATGDWYHFDTPIVLLNNGGAVAGTQIVFPTAFTTPGANGIIEGQLDLTASMLTNAGGLAYSEAQITTSGVEPFTVPVNVPLASFEQFNALQVRRRIETLFYTWQNDINPANIAARRLDVSLSAFRNGFYTG